MFNGSGKAKRIALGGILGALAVVCVFLATVLPTNRLSLYALGSFFISVIILENGIKAGWVFYAATSIVSLAVIPEKTGVIPYIAFFGAYGVIKLYIEKLRKIAVEWALKLVYFNACLAAGALAAKELFGIGLSASVPYGLLTAALEIAFIIYDYVYTLFINYYRTRLRPRL